MAYRRKTGITGATTLKEICVLNKEEVESSGPHHQRIQSDSSRSPSLAAACAIRASAPHLNSSAYGSHPSILVSSPPSPSSSSSPASASKLSCSSSVAASSLGNNPSSSSFHDKRCNPSDSPSTKHNNQSQYGFWGIITNRAKSILQEDDFQTPDRIRSLVIDPSSESRIGHQSDHQSYQSSEGGNKVDKAKLHKRLDAITFSLNNIGDALGNDCEEGHTVVEHKTVDIIQETRIKTADILQENHKIQIRRGGGSTDAQDQATVIHNTSWQRPVLKPVQTNSRGNQETQLKASREVAMATAAKAKVLLRELKTVKADLAFAKERCSQLEEENKRLRDSREKGDNPADDDLVLSLHFPLHFVVEHGLALRKV